MKGHRVKTKIYGEDISKTSFMAHVKTQIRFLLFDRRENQNSSGLGMSEIQNILSLIFSIHIAILLIIPISFCVLQSFDSTLVLTPHPHITWMLMTILATYLLDVFMSGKNLSTSALLFSDHVLHISQRSLGIPFYKKSNVNSLFFLCALIVMNLIPIALSNGFIRVLASVNILILVFSYLMGKKIKHGSIESVENKKYPVWSMLLISTTCMLFYFLISLTKKNIPLTNFFLHKDVNLLFQVGLVTSGLCLLFTLFVKSANTIFNWIENRKLRKNPVSRVIAIFIALSCGITLICTFTILTLQVSLLGVGGIKFIEYICFNFVTTYSLFSLLFCTFLFFFTKHSSLKYISFNLIFVFLVLIVVERYLFEKHENSQWGPLSFVDTPGTVNTDQKIFGFSPVKNSVNHIKGYAQNNLLLWKQTYTIDNNGQRITPKYTPNNKDDKSILFFGCSMTFGHGLRDEGAYPYKVGQLLTNKFKIYNFSYSGYGTHQALSILENNLTDSIVEYQPKYFFYAAIPEHVNRIINLYPWGHDGPKFILDENNKVKFVGYFDEVPLTSYEKFRNKFFESEIYIEMYGRNGWSKDVDLFIAMIDRMQEIIKEKYPACEFHIMYWDNDWAGGHEGLDRKIKSRFKEKEKDWYIHYMRDIIPGYGKNQKSQFIHPLYDPHQKEFVNDTIANYIVKNIIKDK